VITKDDSACNNVKLGVSFIEAEFEVREDSVVPMSPRVGEEKTTDQSVKLSLGFLLCDPAHGSCLFFRETNLNLDN